MAAPCRLHDLSGCCAPAAKLDRAAPSAGRRGTERRPHATVSKDQPADHHHHRLAAAAALVRGQPAGAAVLARHDRHRLPRAVHRCGCGLSLGPGAGRPRSADRRRCALRLRRRRALVVRLCDRAPAGLEGHHVGRGRTASSRDKTRGRHHVRGAGDARAAQRHGAGAARAAGVRAGVEGGAAPDPQARQVRRHIRPDGRNRRARPALQGPARR